MGIKMINYEHYDPSRDAIESEGHLCNSLNAERGFIRHLAASGSLIPLTQEHAERLADYLERAQAVIEYLRRQR